MHIDKEALRAYFQAHRDAIMADLFYLVSHPSVRENDEGYPYGKNSYDCLLASASLYEKEGFRVEIAESKKYALVYYGEGKIEDSVGVFAHTDVVPVNESDWVYTAPFSPIIKDGYVIGRGVGDNKSGVVQALWSLKFIKEKGIVPTRPITVYLGSAEESGMDDIRSFCADKPAPAVSIVPDGGYPVSIGEKGIARGFFTAKRSFEGVLDFAGGSAFNVVLDRATASLSYDKALWEMLVALKGDREDIALEEDGDVIKVTAIGLAAHGADASRGINAGGLLASFLMTVTLLPVGDREILKTAAALLTPCDGSQADIQGDDPNFTPLTMANGMISLENRRLKTSFDIRYGTATDEKTMVEKLKACAERNDCTVEITRLDTGYYHDVSSAPVQTILKLSAEFSEKESKAYTMGGGTYARYLPHAFVICSRAPYAAGTPLPLPKGHGGAHQSDECMSVSAYIEGCALNTAILLSLAAAGGKRREKPSL